MNEQLIRIAEKIRKDNPFEYKEWIEIGFNYPSYNQTNFPEWRSSHIIGEDLDNISIQNNYFGDTPQEALDKLEASLTTPPVIK